LKRLHRWEEAITTLLFVDKQHEPSHQVANAKKVNSVAGRSTTPWRRHPISAIAVHDVFEVLSVSHGKWIGLLLLKLAVERGWINNRFADYLLSHANHHGTDEVPHAPGIKLLRALCDPEHPASGILQQLSSVHDDDSWARLLDAVLSVEEGCGTDHARGHAVIV
jgi:hypothetical protein